MYKGNLRVFILKALSHSNMSGYKLMKVLGEHTGKRPSSGSIYPILEDMTADKVISMKESGRSKLYSITKKGKTEVKESLKSSGCIHENISQSMRLFSSLMDDKEMAQAKEMFEMLIKDKKRAVTFKPEMWSLKTELFRILKDNDPENIAKAKKILTETQNRLKRLK